MRVLACCLMLWASAAMVAAAPSPGQLPGTYRVTTEGGGGYLIAFFEDGTVIWANKDLWLDRWQLKGDRIEIGLKAAAFVAEVQGTAEAFSMRGRFVRKDERSPEVTLKLERTDSRIPPASDITAAQLAGRYRVSKKGQDWEVVFDEQGQVYWAQPGGPGPLTGNYLVKLGLLRIELNDGTYGAALNGKMVGNAGGFTFQMAEDQLVFRRLGR